MYFNIDGRDEKYWLKLKSFIEENYQLKVISMKEYNRGWYGETWKIECNNNSSYFVKIIYFEKQAEKDRQSFSVLDFMHLHGIDYVSKVYNTQNNESFVLFNSGTLAVFDFAEGVHAEDKPKIIVPLMVNIYKLPKTDLYIERETFMTDTFAYLQSQMDKLQCADALASQLVKSNWEFLVDTNNKQNRYAEICGAKADFFAITSGDVGGNTLVHGGRYTIIDWDWIKLAPPERDFWWYVQFPEQIDEINRLFKQYGFDYVMDSDLIGYYAFFSYIYFLTETIDCLLFNPASQPEIIQRLKDHFDEDGYLRKYLRNAVLLDKS
jgi:hypothetical protein